MFLVNKPGTFSLSLALIARRGGLLHEFSASIVDRELPHCVPLF
jgi:hypothetical protein